VESPTVATYPFAGERGDAGLTGASSKGGKCVESPPTFICGKRRKKRRKPVIKNILDSGVVFTFEEGISTSHVCPKGQQP